MTTPEVSNTDPLSAHNVHMLGRQDKLEDLEDFPPIPTAMVLPHGTTYHVTVRHLKRKKLKKLIVRRRKEGRKRKRYYDDLVSMEETADKTDDVFFFFIYNVFAGSQDTSQKFKRLAKWLRLRAVDEQKALEYEARCKREDSLKDIRKFWQAIFAREMLTIKDHAQAGSIAVNLSQLRQNIYDDLEDFFKTSTWDKICEKYSIDPLSTAWFGEDNHYLMEEFKSFMLKKYKTALLDRYKTLLSTSVKNPKDPLYSPVIEKFKVSVERALKAYLNEILKVENAYYQDIQKIAERQTSPSLLPKVLSLSQKLGLF
ncbi:MAG: hypothetical protein ACQEP8_00585 [Chlamydiota bacterium]